MMLKETLAAMGGVVLLVVAFFAVATVATTAEIYFSSDKNGQIRVTSIQEGQQIWICVYDPDQNIDCDLRDKIWTDVRVFDPNTGAYIVWNSYSKADPDGSPSGYAGGDGSVSKGNYLDETGADTGLFTSNTPFQIGRRENYANAEENTHVVGQLDTSADNPAGVSDFQWGNYLYAYAGTRGWFAPGPTFKTGLMPSDLTPVMPSGWDSATSNEDYLVGRFQNLDTLVGIYQDPNDTSDVAVMVGKITSTQATISWDREVYKDQRSAATITVKDLDENLNCNAVEYVPVFVIINPGSWNPEVGSPINSFCMLKSTGGVTPDGTPAGTPLSQPIRWYNIYNSAIGAQYPQNSQPRSTGAYYLEYPTKTSSPGSISFFGTTDPNGFCRVMFYAQETGVSTGVFQLNLNDIAVDLGFTTLNVRDVLAAYYLDPNDFSDFHIATAYIEENVSSITSLTDAERHVQSTYWIGRDPLYVQVIDGNANVDACCPEPVVVHVCDPHSEDDNEWLSADEMSSNSPIFFTNAGIELLPVWDALGNGLSRDTGGYQLQVGNWKIEAFNSDNVCVRYNDVSYARAANPGTALIIGDSVVVASHGTVLISVTGMPQGGMASMEVDVGGMTYNTSKISNVTIAPLSGFIVSASEFNDATGKGRFVIANANSGVVAGAVASLTFTVSGSLASGDLTFDKTHVSLGSAMNTMITGWQLVTGKTYYTNVGIIDRVRVANDVSFAQMEIGDTQVYDGSKTEMYFLDRQGNRIFGYVNSDCVFVEVVDPDQNEDSYRRERIDAYWDGGQNIPFGPVATKNFGCNLTPGDLHPINPLLGKTNIFNDYPPTSAAAGNIAHAGWAQLYILNPRNGRWAIVDFLETGVDTGDFVSATCIDLTSQYDCVPTLGMKPGDTIIAVYQDPSNHADSAWISIKVGIGGASMAQASSTLFVDAEGNKIESYFESDDVYAKVVDLSHVGESQLLGAVSISGKTYDLTPLAGEQSDTFITEAISMSDLGAKAGDTLTATYIDPTDPADTSSATTQVTASALSVTNFYAGPNPFSATVDFAYHGTGIARTFSVAVYDLSGHLVWNDEATNVSKVTWDGTNQRGSTVANGAYIYVVMATDGMHTFRSKGTVFINR